MLKQPIVCHLLQHRFATATGVCGKTLAITRKQSATTQCAGFWGREMLDVTGLTGFGSSLLGIVTLLFSGPHSTGIGSWRPSESGAKTKRAFCRWLCWKGDRREVKALSYQVLYHWITNLALWCYRMFGSGWENCIKAVRYFNEALRPSQLTLVVMGTMFSSTTTHMPILPEQFKILRQFRVQILPWLTPPPPFRL
jgi:hypothetical protein